jgi:mRNA interferase HicA
VSVSEFRRWLKKQACTFHRGKKHEKVQLGTRETVLPRHPSQELAAGTMKAIKKQLGLKE